MLLMANKHGVLTQRLPWDNSSTMVCSLALFPSSFCGPLLSVCQRPRRLRRDCHGGEGQKKAFSHLCLCLFSSLSVADSPLAFDYCAVRCLHAVQLSADGTAFDMVNFRCVLRAHFAVLSAQLGSVSPMPVLHLFVSCVLSLPTCNGNPHNAGPRQIICGLVSLE